MEYLIDNGRLYNYTTLEGTRCCTLRRAKNTPTRLFVSRCAVNLERKDTVQVTMPKPYIKYKIISSSRSWDICYKSVNGRTRWLQYSPLSMSGGIIYTNGRLYNYTILEGIYPVLMLTFYSAMFQCKMCCYLLVYIELCWSNSKELLRHIAKKNLSQFKSNNKVIWM